MKKNSKDLINEISHLSTLIEVSKGYPACQVYSQRHDEKIRELVVLVTPKPKITLKKRFKLWLIKQLSD